MPLVVPGGREHGELFPLERVVATVALITPLVLGARCGKLKKAVDVLAVNLGKKHSDREPKCKRES